MSDNNDTAGLGFSQPLSSGVTAAPAPKKGGKPSKISVPFPKEPTKEELLAASESWWAFAGPTFYDQWPEDLRKLSVPTTMIPLDHAFAERMIDWFYEQKHKGVPRPQEIDNFARRLDDAMDWQDRFVRLNSRSPKDAADPGLPITNAGRQAIAWIVGSMRCFDDIVAFRHLPPERGAYVLLREPAYYDKSTEIRAFIRDRKVIASTVYHFNDVEVMEGWADPDAHADYRRKVEEYLNEVVIPACHLDTFVADVAQGRRRAKEGPSLIEINPYGASHPCLFDSYAEIERWSGGLKRTANPTTESA